MTKPTPQSHFSVWVQDYDGEWYPSGHAHSTLTDAAIDLTCAVNISQWSFARYFHVQRIDAGSVLDMTAAAACMIIAWNDARDGEAWKDENKDNPVAKWLRKSGMSWHVASARGRSLEAADKAMHGVAPAVMEAAE